MVNRRRFLKYAGATVAVVGASALGLDYILNRPQIPSQQATQTQILPSSSLASVTSSATSTSSKELVSLAGKLFVGWDGNGIEGEEVSPLSNEEMVLVSVGGGSNPNKIFAETTSDSSGLWKMDDLPIENYILYAQGPPEFRYMCQSNKDFAPVNVEPFYYNDVDFGGYSLLLNEPQKMSFEFSNGFLTLPFLKGTIPIIVNNYFDEGNGTDWLGQPNNDPGLQGIDFRAPIGTPVVSAAPGKVYSITDMGLLGLFLVIDHSEFTGTEVLSTFYAHLSKVEVSEGQQVYRGQRIGLSGEAKTHPGPHLHFELDSVDYHGSSDYWPLDPYASLWKSDSESIGYWTKKNDPQFSV